jgi:phosphoribosylformylglycinamidine synthase
MKEVCEELKFPVVSGNVSFYNETDGQGIFPTPVIGGIGLIEDYGQRNDF